MTRASEVSFPDGEAGRFAGAGRSHGGVGETRRCVREQNPSTGRGATACSAHRNTGSAQGLVERLLTWQPGRGPRSDMTKLLRHLRRSCRPPRAGLESVVCNVLTGEQHMDSARTDVQRPGRRITVLIMAVIALAGSLLAAAPAAAATTPFHAPFGAFLASSNLAQGQFCDQRKPLSRTPSPILGVSKGAPSYNTGRPDIKATFEVAPLEGAPIVSGTVSLYLDPARFQVPAGILGEGEYRFRARAVDGKKVSAWLPWCGFTVDTVNVPTPGVPIGLRMSAYPYEGFQYCESGDPVVYASFAPTLAASPPDFNVHPNLVARFEVARPGRESLIVAGNPYGVAAPEGALPSGAYQFRARLEEGDMASAWSPWCDFVSQ
jgi:hypothetical protein